MDIKASWSVQAGLYPGDVIPEYSKQWVYTSDDFEADKSVPKNQPTIFSKLDEEVHLYARHITNPFYVNYVRVDFLWY